MTLYWFTRWIPVCITSCDILQLLYKKSLKIWRSNFSLRWNDILNNDVLSISVMISTFRGIGQSKDLFQGHPWQHFRLCLAWFCLLGCSIEY